MDNNIQTIVPGEASESDEEEVNTTMPQTETSQERIATVVSGEASESEEEEEKDHGDKESQLPPLKVDTDGKGDHDDITSGDLVITPTSPVSKTQDTSRLKYDTLLHRKLRERNGALRRHIVDSIHQAYQTSSKDLHNTTQQLHKSQSVVMDISHTMRLLTNDLFYLEDKIDIIATCKILPDISITKPIQGASS